MARRFHGPALPLMAAPSAPTLAEETGHYIRKQADESLKSGMGMTEFFSWATHYAISIRGISSDEACTIILAAWDAAWEEWRDEDLARMVA